MKVLRLHNIGDLRLHEEPTPPGLKGEILLRITSAGICGSDLHWYADGTTGDATITTPFVLGHEFAGIIQTGEMSGKRVAVEPEIPCWHCEFCEEGNPNLCPHHEFAGQTPKDGAFQEYLNWPQRNCFILPDEITDDEGAMLEPLGIAIHTVDLGKIKPGMTVGVFGSGPIGLLIIQMARISGAARIIATDKYPHRLNAAKEFGATDVYLSTDGGENNQIWAATQNRGLDVTFEAAGENPAVETAVETVKPGGRVVLCGIPAINTTSFRASTARRKGLTIKLVRRMKHTYPRAIRLVTNRIVNVKSLISHRFPLEAYKDAFEIAEKRAGLKVVLTP